MNRLCSLHRSPDVPGLPINCTDDDSFLYGNSYLSATKIFLFLSRFQSTVFFKWSTDGFQNHQFFFLRQKFDRSDMHRVCHNYLLVWLFWMLKLIFLQCYSFDFFLQGLSCRFHTCTGLLDGSVFFLVYIVILINFNCQKLLLIWFFVNLRTKFLCSCHFELFYDGLSRHISIL